MLDLKFQVEGAEPHRSAVVPELLFRLVTMETTGAAVRSIILRCQVRIEPARRHYDNQEQAQLLDLFGSPDRWDQTVRDMLWTNVSVAVPPFVGETTVELPVPCTHDFAVAATKYFDALVEGGEVPLSFLFSGTVFYTIDDSELQVAQIPWDKATRYRMPVTTWKDLMDSYYPNAAWLWLRKDVFDQLHRYRSRHGLTTWEQTIEELLSRDSSPRTTSEPTRGIH